MREKIDLIFSILDKNHLSYYLLRPLDFRATIHDIDLIISKDEYSKLKQVLAKEFGQLYYKPSNANSSTQLLVDGLLLDIKFDVCFLPRKSLVLNYQVPYSSVTYKAEDLLVPDVKEEKLFTFWVHHLFLDKIQASDSSTFDVFKDLFSNKWRELLLSDFFTESLTKIYSPNHSVLAKHMMESFFDKGMPSNDKEVNRNLKKLVLSNSIRLQLKYVYDKLKFGVYRRIGLYENYRAIK